MPVFNFKRPKEGDSVEDLWKYVTDIMDQLEAFTITITPQRCGVAMPTEGDIELRLTTIPIDMLPQLGGGGGGVDDTGSDDSDGLGDASSD